MFKNKKITFFLLALIFVLALFLRIYKLGSVPYGFHIDESSLGYNGYSLLLTGKDDNNNPFPLYIDMFGDYRPAGYHYLTILPIIAFGLTEFATRLPGALFGSLTIIAFFFFTQVLLKNKRISLLSSLFVAVSPWHVNLSRSGNEPIVALFFIISGFTLFFYSIEKEKIIYAIFSSILLSFSFFFYHTPRVFVPLLLLALILALYKVLLKRTLRFRIDLIISFALVSFLALLLIFTISGGTGRFNQVNIFSSFETDFFQKQQIQEDAVAKAPFFSSRFFHNKITNVSLVFVSNYLDYFGFNFLFTKGGLPIWYIIPRIGLIYLLELPLLLIGIYYLLKSRELYQKLPLVWLLIAPIVPAITMDDVPNINRAVVMFSVIELIAAFGLITILDLLKGYKKNLLLVGFAIFFTVNIFYFLHQYYFNAKTNKPWYRNNGFSEMMKVVRSSYDSYDSIVMSKYQGGIYPLVLFYMKFDPREYQMAGSPKNKDYSGFGKFFFVPQDCPSFQYSDKFPKGKELLYIDKGDCPWDKSLALRRHSFIYREDGTKAFRIVYE